jgi:hypothetical protein
MKNVAQIIHNIFKHVHQGLKVLHQMQHHHCSLNDTLILVMCDNTTPNINPHIAYAHKTHTHRLRIVPHWPAKAQSTPVMPLSQIPNRDCDCLLEQRQRRNWTAWSLTIAASTTTYLQLIQFIPVLNENLIAPNLSELITTQFLYEFFGCNPTI